ncbi:histidine kinase [Sphingobium sp. Cam5-1]|uniref:histidine kinase n=1 Tax=Sphingobium sp. Cam5-1 TaxID=2789327 RepID=UPI0018AD2E52|nr:histidine kinase [Sphingobium sp. Cam5-1]QPI74705.1 histidine kinase [Sphingobium sp. Cam5-1]
MSKKRSKSWLLTLLGRSSAVALAVGCGAGVAQVNKAFQGSYSVQSGDAFVSQGSSAGTDTISLNSSEAIINWTPDDTSGTGPIDFLPQNNTVVFSGFSDFTVLNRILPVNGSGVSVSRMIELNGTVQSQINGSTGGKVWFYAPGGIVAGPNALFNVGSLVLTSNDIDTTGGLYGSGGEIRFRGPSNALTSVELKPGAQINALSSGSYVALVAPRVVQGGTVAVNGAAAYVGAEAADIRINGGLFDISISAGTTDANGVVHTGSTERPGATVTDAQHVFMVAMPKNQALTMLLSGNVGYDAAASAVQVDSAVVLSAGYDLANGAIGPRNMTGTGEASVSIGGGTWQPDVTGQATGNIVVQPSAAANFANLNLTAERAITLQSGAAGAIAATGTMDLKAGEAITVRADQGGSISVGGNMNLTTGIGGTGGTIDVLTFGGSALPTGNGQIDVTGTMQLDANAYGLGGISFPVLAGGDATGGAINVIAAGGSISASSLLAHADATAGAGSDSAGNAMGGAITVSARTAAGPSGPLAGGIDFGTMSLSATAGVEYSFPVPAVTGGNATGGTINVSAAGGSITTGYFDIYANATGGDSIAVAGTGTGGGITLSASAANGLRGSFAADCTSYCNITADGRGGYGANGANGTGGSILIQATDASFVADGSLYLHAKGVGGETASFDGVAGTGGDGLGGSIAVESRAGAQGSAVMRFGTLFAYADGVSTENVEGTTYNEGDGGNGTGGTVNLLVAGGSFDATILSAGAYGRGGASSVNCPSCGDGVTPFQAGSGQGGSVQFLMTGGTANIASLELGAGGIGGEAVAANASDEVTSLAGTGTGGTAILESRGGVLNADSISIEANGAGGGPDPYYSFYSYNGPNGADGGAGIGGTARLLMGAGGTGQIVVTGELGIRARGHGGAGGEAGFGSPGGLYTAGAGGNGTGGTAELTLASGALTAPSLLVSAEGIGGAGGNNSSDGAGGAAGKGTGGTARVAYLSEGHAIGALNVSASGEGGQAGINRYINGFDQVTGDPIYAYGPGQGGAGGAGTGGTADMLIDVDPGFASLIVSADGIGSAGADSASSGAGGTGTGGTAALNIGFGATSVSGELRVSASGFGGAGGVASSGAAGRGGDAFGGAATLGLTGASTSLDAGDIGVLAEAFGGAGGIGAFQSGLGLAGADGGDAQGGTALFAVNAGASAVTGANLLLSGDATGGAGSAGIDGLAGGAGGSGGNAAGGSATLQIDGGKLRVSNSFSTLPAYSITAVGQGGAGADGGVASDPALADGAGGNGGAGAGGVASFEASDGDFLLGPLSIIADGAAGLAGVGGIDGLTSGGTASLTNGGSVALGAGVQRQLASLAMTANGGAGGRISFADSSSAAGGGLRVAGPMTLHAVGKVVPGFTGISFAASGNVVQVDGAADFLTEGPLSFAFNGGGALAVTGALTGYSGTSIAFSHAGRAAGTDSLSAASIALDTPGGISAAGASLRSAGLLTMLARGGDIALSGGSALTAGGDLRLFAQGSIDGAGGDLLSGGRAAIGLGGAGGITLGNLSSAGLLDMADASGNALGGSGIAIGGDFVIGGTLTIGAGSGTLSAARINIGTLNADSQTLTATGGLQIGNAVTSGDLIVDGSLQLGGSDIGGLLQQRGAAAQFGGQVLAGAIDIDADSISGAVMTARTGDLLLRSIGALNIADAQAAGDISMTSGGALTIGNAVAGGSLALNGSGISAQALASGGAATLDAGAGDLVVNDLLAEGAITALGRNISLGSSGGMAIANAVASGDVLLNAAGLVAVNGQVSGQAVTIGSGDIAISANGQVSAAGLLRFDALGAQAFIGGGDATAGYSLSAAELGRVSAGGIAIAGAGDVAVRDLTIGTNVLPGDGVMSIGAAGLLRVQGAVAMTGRTGVGGLTLTAGDALEVIAGLGSVAISDGNGGLGGVLTLDAPSIYVATAEAIADVRAADSLTARDLRLAQNDGLALDAGMLQAGTIRLAATDGTFIQNSGLSTSFADRRGFTANSLIISSGSASPQIAINGRLALAGGNFATGLDTIPLVAIDGGYAAGSKINGCFLFGSCTTLSFDNRETFDGLLDPTVAVSRIFPAALIELRDVVTQGFPPLIDEPVTGAGNEDLWDRSCGEPGEPACDAQ